MHVVAGSDTVSSIVAKGADPLTQHVAQTVKALYNFILAMLLYPEVQTAAQAELDQVIEHSRLPEMADKATLPYISAITKEVLR